MVSTLEDVGGVMHRCVSSGRVTDIHHRLFPFHLLHPCSVLLGFCVSQGLTSGECCFTHGALSLLLLLSKWLRKRLSSTREVLDPLDGCIHLLAVPEPRRVGENADAIAVDSSKATEKAQNWDIYNFPPQCFDGNRCERCAPKTRQKKNVPDAPHRTSRKIWIFRGNIKIIRFL